MDRLAEALISFGEVDPQRATDLARLLFSRGVTVLTLKGKIHHQFLTGVLREN